MEPKVIFLCTTMTLWMLHTSAPVFDSTLPTVYVEGTKGTAQLPLSQIINQLVGLATYISSFAWLHSVRNGQWYTTTLPFLCCGYFIWTGHGIHFACVVAENSDTAKGHPVFGLIDFLHERISHNMFVGGYYGMVMVIMYAEMSLAVKWFKLRKQKDHHHQSSSKLNPMKVLYRIPFDLLLPAVIGNYFSVFSSRTGTVAVTWLFYCGVGLMGLLAFRKTSQNGVSWLDIFSGHFEQLWTLSTFVKASIIGGILLVIL